VVGGGGGCFARGWLLAAGWVVVAGGDELCGIG